MIRLPGITLPLDMDDTMCRSAAAKLLHVPLSSIMTCRIARKSIDARRKDSVQYVITLDVSVSGDETQLLANCRHPGATIAPPPCDGISVQQLSVQPNKRPIVAGSGPAGLFAALTLALAGAAPILIERGRDVRSRRSDVDAFWQSGTLMPHSNVQFGEGGAGTFSDGKLNTGTKDPRAQAVLQTFAECGAPEEILWQAKPHIGTDRLTETVENMRKRICALGGEVRFETALTGLHVENGTLRGIHAAQHTQATQLDIDTDHVVLALGQSALDTFEMLCTAGVSMMQKPFSMGVRIEHPQVMINRAQYGQFADRLPAAEYKLSAHLKNGRGVYSFCMCPGGLVVASASEVGGVVTNGMSHYARDLENANSALLVDVRPEDFGQGDVLAGFRFRQKFERQAFEAGGSTYAAPAQRVEDFLSSRASRHLGNIKASYRPGVTPADLRACLPAFVIESLAEGIGRFGRQIQGFAMPDAVLTGVETRSSCPVRIPRDETGQANIRGLYPTGEGAGYAGGILSAAVDGIRIAECVLSSLRGND